VLLDSEGHFNYLARLSASAGAHLLSEARRSFALLEDPTRDGFHALFMTPLQHVLSFDAFCAITVELPETPSLRYNLGVGSSASVSNASRGADGSGGPPSISSSGLPPALYAGSEVGSSALSLIMRSVKHQACGYVCQTCEAAVATLDGAAAVSRLVHRVLARALSDRVALVHVAEPKPVPAPSETSGRPRKRKTRGAGEGDAGKAGGRRRVVLTVSFRLNPSQAGRIVDKGPLPELKAEVSEFRAFWGSKSSLRRFPDGSIREAVAWPELAASRARVVEAICRHIVPRHLPADVTVSYAALFACITLVTRIRCRHYSSSATNLTARWLTPPSVHYPWRRCRC
jgi:hypothetical protein